MKKKLIKYSLEFLVIFLGISLSFIINNWNENKKRKIIEIKHLKELKSDIVETLKDASQDEELNIIDIQSTLYLQDFFFQNTTYSDSLSYHFYRVTQHYQMYPKTSALESIKSIGLDIISNDSIRLKVTDFYQVHIQNLVDVGRVSQGQTNFANSLWPYFEEHFKPINKSIRKDNDWYSDTITAKYPPKKWQVLDVVKLQKDYKLQLLLDKKMLDRQGSVAYSNRVIIKGEELLKLINTELTKHNN
tara:strand:+ start:66 stop:803 length:738 start_codon:yes stop_codon:yes gene_type:complete